MRDIYFAGSDGTRLHSLFASSPSSNVTVLYFGGDSFQIGRDGLTAARLFASLEVNILLIDYRGYGLSEGSPTLSTIQTDAAQAFDLASTLSKPPNPVVVHGFSMGSFVAASLTEHRAVEALVLESSATSVAAWARHQVPWYVKPFVRVRLDESLRAESNELRLQRYQGYLLLCTGSADHITPPSMSRSLFSMAASPESKKRLYIAPHAKHGTALLGRGAATQYTRFVSLVSGRRAALLPPGDVLPISGLPQIASGKCSARPSNPSYLDSSRKR